MCVVTLWSLCEEKVIPHSWTDFQGPTKIVRCCSEVENSWCLSHSHLNETCYSLKLYWPTGFKELLPFQIVGLQVIYFCCCLSLCCCHSHVWASNPSSAWGSLLLLLLQKSKRGVTLWGLKEAAVHSDGRIDLYQMWCKASSWCEECTSCKGDDEECRPWCCKACNLSSENLFFLGITTEWHAMCTILNLPPSFCNTRNTRRRPGYTTVTRHKFLSL